MVKSDFIINLFYQIDEQLKYEKKMIKVVINKKVRNNLAKYQ